MCYQIITDGVGKYIKQVQELGDYNRRTLGFFPEGAFQEYAQNHQIYCAMDKDHVVGYVLFRFVKRRNCIILIHVCVDLTKRKSGLAHELINRVAQDFQNANYMEARCRRDYNLDGFWQSCGFYIQTETDGRRITGSDLTIWRKNLNQVNFFNYLLREERKEKTFAVLDSNIIIQLCDAPDSRDHCLFNPNIKENVKYFITPECPNEINKKEDPAIRRRHLAYALKFQLLDNIDLNNDLIDKLLGEIDPNQTHISDVKHLAYCIISGVDAFITNDRWIHDQNEHFGKYYNLMIFYPEEFFTYILAYDEHNVDRRIIGSKYQFMCLDNKTMHDAINLYQNADVKKHTWEAELKSNLIDSTINTWLLYDDVNLVGLISVKGYQSYLRINRFIITTSNERRIYRYLVLALLNKSIMYYAQKNEINVIFLPFCNDAVFTMAVNECGFIPTQSGALKIIAAGLHKKVDLLNAVKKHLEEMNDFPDYGDSIHTVIDLIFNIDNNHEYALELLLGPTTITDLAIRTYIISIKPQYAVDLFDDKLAYANQSMLDNPHVYAALSMSNAYYTTSSIRFQTPCRILWYVTQDHRYWGSGAIRASSIMYYHKLGTPEQIYKEYCQFGVLEWHNVNSTKKLGVFLFNNTICFDQPVSFHDLVKLTDSIQTKKVALQGPMSISDTLAQLILNEGSEE